MLAAIVLGFLVSLMAPLLCRSKGAGAGLLLALLPFSFLIYFLTFLYPVRFGETFRVTYPWVSSLNIEFSFHLDGLSLFFVIIIAAVGFLIFVYASGYFERHRQIGRFYAYLCMFTTSMLGLVLADNIFALFVFWELTSISSYLLIGFDHEGEATRAAALQALLVTAAGGLALLAGLILLAQAGGSYELSALLASGNEVKDHSLYIPIFLLIVLGAFTKSAQFPFHFWLPAAMAAPTPVSAYLHSATMVKAGIYLLARLYPVLGGTDAWHFVISAGGAVTMLIGAAWALVQTDLKRILAYSTVSVLGTLTLLLGLGSTQAITAAIVFLFVHSLYKGALFLAAGAVDHEAGTRDVRRLSGLRKAMPVTAVITGLAALSMAGVPPLFGFISKELLYEAKLHLSEAAFLITGAGVLANILLVAAAALVFIQPFFGKEVATPKGPHDPPWQLLLGPGTLAGLGLAIGLFPDILAAPLLKPAIAAVRAEPTELKLALWHGFNPVLALSLVTLIFGAAAYAGRERLCRVAAWVERNFPGGPERAYELALASLNKVARAQTHVLQNGYLRFYLLTVIATTVVFLGAALNDGIRLPMPTRGLDIHFYEAVVAVLLLAGAVSAARVSSRLGAVALLGAVGYGVALIFIIFSAPDLAMTQFLVESLTVILFVLTLYHLPDFARLTPAWIHLRDIVVAVSLGGLVTALVWAATRTQPDPTLSAYFAEQAVPRGHGRNIVNVILVDFRALDTLGEITVLGIAAMGVFALLKFRKDKSS